MRAFRLFVVVFVTCTLVAFAAVNNASAARVGLPAADSSVRINQIQVIGTHNSFHVEATATEEALRNSFDPVGEKALEYGHPKLATQFGQQNVRQIELDVFADPNGGLYARPLIRTLASEGAYTSDLNAPGAKVLHLQDIDYASNCLTFIKCLTEVKAWSRANPTHVPIPILVQLSDAPIVLPNVPLQLTKPIVWDVPQMNSLDAEIRKVFDRSDVITPDDVRGKHATLQDAVLHNGWPTLQASRGKVMFLMDNGGNYRTAYLAGHPSLKGRLLFTNSVVGQADAAFIEENDPTGINFARIQKEVRSGYIVRTRADVDTVQARTGDTSMRDSALASGAQLVSTDYPVAGIASRFGTKYVAQLPGGVSYRCNPVNSTKICVDLSHR